jgi:hypothetical protein
MKTIALLLGIAFSTLSDKANRIHVDLSELERNARALELYLQDQEDHQTYCPEVQWNQPSLSTYKEQLRSHLPRGCKS